MKRKLVFSALLLAVGLVVWFVLFNYRADAPDQGNNTQTSSEEAEAVEFDKTKYSLKAQDSLWLVVNKQRPISTEYVPVDLVDVNVNKRTDKSAEELMLRQEAAKALEQLFAGASNSQLLLLMGSAYRSASLQNSYYTNYVASYGQAEADKFSAKPGTSEHQTGLAADISTADRSCYLEVCFADTTEGKWLAKNAHKYGFIVRYQDGKEAVTGYQYEPWHIRYVGKELADEMYKTNQVMEEFFEL